MLWLKHVKACVKERMKERRKKKRKWWICSLTCGVWVHYVMLVGLTVTFHVPTGPPASGLHATGSVQLRQRRVVQLCPGLPAVCGQQSDGNDRSQTLRQRWWRRRQQPTAARQPPSNLQHPRYSRQRADGNVDLAGQFDLQHLMQLRLRSELEFFHPLWVRFIWFILPAYVTF